jgi:hypothetical protein
VVPTPQNDPFYVPPAGFQSAADGAVLRSRPIVATALAVPLPVSAWQVLYKTLDAHDLPIATVATILVPLTAWNGPGQRPLVSYQTAEDSVGDQCAPSYVIRSGPGGLSSNAEMETPIITSLLARNWAVVTSDYEGPASHFLAGPASGYAVLDGIRAAMSYAPSGLTATTPVALWGYSGGAFATAWASALRSTHAPALSFTGVALGGLPADLEPAMRNIDGGYGSGLIMGALIGLQRAYPESGVKDMFTWLGRAALSAGGDDCSASLIVRYAFQPLKLYTTSKTPWDDARMDALLAANSPLGKGTAPLAPVYSYHGNLDELVPVSIANAVVADYCASGTPVQVVRDPIGEHNLVLVSGSVGAQQFVADRFAGVPPVNNC